MGACRMCGHREDHRVFSVREMMFGLREAFAYFECAACGSLQIAEVPADLSPYYPPRYYAFNPVGERGPIRRFLKRRRYMRARGKPDVLGAFLIRCFGRPRIAEWTARAGVRRRDAVLDVGCGNGALLVEMHACGFSDLEGIDPYIGCDLYYRDAGVRVRKCTLQDYHGRRDFVMVHHAFEHMDDPRLALERIRCVLRPGGCALIRLPVAGTHAWRTYGPDWFQLDAPRHVVVPTVDGMRIAAGHAGFQVEAVVFDSTAQQFWASEQYRRDIPLKAPRSYGVDPGASVFSAADIAHFEREADELNRRGDGDQACFYLRRSLTT